MSGTDRLGAALLAVLAVLAFSPIPAIDGLWIGSQTTGMGTGKDGVWVAIGLVTFLAGVIPVMMLALAPGVWHGRRRATRWAAVLALLATLVATGPLREISLASWIPGGRALVLVLGLGTAVLLAARSRVGGEERSRGPAVAALALLAVLVVGAVAGRAADGLPTSPSSLLISDFESSDMLSGTPLRGLPPAGNPALAVGQGSNVHNDAAMSDAYFGRVPIDPEAAEVRSFKALGDCVSILFDRRGRLIAVCVSATENVAYLLDPDTLEPLAERRIAGRELTGNFATNFAGGAYAYLDAAQRLVVPTADGTIERFRAGGAPGDEEIAPVDDFDVSATLADDEPLTSALPDWSGRIWYVGSEGTVGVLNPVTGRARSLRFEDADIENSFALAPGGGAYVVSSRELAFLRIGPAGAPRIVWSQSYDQGSRQKPGQSSRASGTTPTVMLGGRFVTIADNAEPRMHVQVYDTRPGVRGSRLVCETPVFADDESATENSLAVVGGSIFVENNYGYRLFDSLGGHVPEPGAARIDFDPRAGTCELAWSNDDVHIPSVVSKVAADDGTYLTYTKKPYWTGIEAWWFTAIDAGTGEVLWRRLAGTGAIANNHYAALYLGPTGNVYVGTVGGVIAMTPP